MCDRVSDELPQRLSGQHMCPLLVSKVTADPLPTEMIRRLLDGLYRLDDGSPCSDADDSTGGGSR